MRLPEARQIVGAHIDVDARPRLAESVRFSVIGDGFIPDRAWRSDPDIREVHHEGGNLWTVILRRGLPDPRMALRRKLAAMGFPLRELHAESRQIVSEAPTARMDAEPWGQDIHRGMSRRQRLDQARTYLARAESNPRRGRKHAYNGLGVLPPGRRELPRAGMNMKVREVIAFLASEIERLS